VYQHQQEAKLLLR